MNKNNQFSSEPFSVNLLVFKSYFQVKRFPFFRDNFDILVTTEILLENGLLFNPGSDQTGFALSFFGGGWDGRGEMGGPKPNECFHTFKPTTDTSLRLEHHIKKLKAWKQKPRYIVHQFTEYFLTPDIFVNFNSNQNEKCVP
jgi:hypothetical protein